MQLTTRHPGAMQGSKEVYEHGHNGIRKLHDTLQESKDIYLMEASFPSAAPKTPVLFSN